MNEEKIEQNIERTRNYLFQVLGCNNQEAIKILNGTIKMVEGEQ